MADGMPQVREEALPRTWSDILEDFVLGDVRSFPSGDRALINVRHIIARINRNKGGKTFCTVSGRDLFFVVCTTDGNRSLSELERRELVARLRAGQYTVEK